MAQEYTDPLLSVDYGKEKMKFKQKYWVHISLLVITFITSVIAGMEWTTGEMGPYEFDNLVKGLPYALSVIFVLGFHEFGHFFAAKFHKVSATLPYFIPFPPIPGFFNFGTMGAVIRTREAIPNNKAMFDIGVAGPLAGFVASVALLVYGFSNLPGTEYLLNIHPNYFSPEYGADALSLEFGDTILFAALRNIFTDPSQFIPPMSEIYHYPYLLVGWFGLFITAMNMIPVGQLDGGHIVYSLFGNKIHEAVASASLAGLGFLGFSGALTYFLDLDFGFGWTGWLFWAFVLIFVIKVKHPPVRTFEKLSLSRRLIGYFSLFILVISFSPTPFVISF